jgi:hypothetical protein
MAFFSDCPSCSGGDHSGHVEHWGKRTEGVIDGDFCRCSGDCAERSEKRFDDMFRVPAVFLSPEASDLLRRLRSTDPATQEDAVRTVNRLMANDPLEPHLRDAKETS